ncbi:MAG: TatD family hydrolase [Hyphomonadaceae bacterium]|nr:TatD family hydrolase [Hyphomonadaceae bacterium]
MLIDSHVNLHAEAFADDVDAVIARARAAGVARMITICDRMEHAQTVRMLAHSHTHMYASVGAHPHYAKDHQDLSVQSLLQAAEDPIVAAIGETGLDLHYGFSPLAEQLRVFRTHIAAARASGLPLIVHTREADALTAEVLEEEYAAGAFPILLHCYTSGIELARRGLALGAVISFSGILAFKNAEEVRAVAREAPLDRVILETDCPYLAPPPHRGRRCEPAMVGLVYDAFARLRGLEREELTARVWETFHRLFPRIAA